LEESIQALRKAILLTPDGHSGLSSMLNNLGNSLHSRYIHYSEDESYRMRLAPISHATAIKTRRKMG
jgi:hypothetical protein